MAFKIKLLTVDEAKAEFKRSGSNLENLGEYIDTVRGLSVGEGFTVHVQRVKTVEEGEDGKEKIEFKDVVTETTTEEGEADTVRAFKRRMNAAAESLNLNLKWKIKGHLESEPDGTPRQQTDWLSAKVVATKAEAVDEDEETPANGKTAVAAK